jgi:hypothetical protein
MEQPGVRLPGVLRDQRQLFVAGLSDQHAIKGVSMMQRQMLEMLAMGPTDLQPTKPLNIWLRSPGIESLPNWSLMAISQADAALKLQTASSSEIAARAFGLSFSGSKSHHSQA